MTYNSNLGFISDERAIRMMLEAQMKTDGLVWWVGAYAYGHTTKGDPYVMLYPLGDKFEQKVCKVYPKEFKKLPAFIPTENIPADIQGKNAPDVSDAKRMGVYRECLGFQVVLYLAENTAMGNRRKRLQGVIRYSKDAQGALKNGRQPSRPATTQQPRQQTRQAATPPPPANGSSQNNKPHHPILIMIQGAANISSFNKAVYDGLKDTDLFTNQERIIAIRELVAPNWQLTNMNKLPTATALKIYRDKRRDIEGEGQSTRIAHQNALSEAIRIYNKGNHGAAVWESVTW